MCRLQPFSVIDLVSESKQDYMQIDLLRADILFLSIVVIFCKYYTHFVQSAEFFFQQGCSVFMQYWQYGMKKHLGKIFFQCFDAVGWVI